ncbi:MAG: MraZ protein putative antitoxin-like, partial [Planctomycetota bacterium]
MFLGEYEHSLDAKQRLAIPAEIRDSWKAERHGDAFIAAPGQNGQLWLWPERKFEEHADRLPKCGKAAQFRRAPRVGV